VVCLLDEAGAVCAKEERGLYVRRLPRATALARRKRPDIEDERIPKIYL
jgi:hypothetical protein